MNLIHNAIDNILAQKQYTGNGKQKQYHSHENNNPELEVAGEIEHFIHYCQVLGFLLPHCSVACKPGILYYVISRCEKVSGNLPEAAVNTSLHTPAPHRCSTGFGRMPGNFQHLQYRMQP
ncbi:MAG TPA: hypothetical protein PLB10_13875 [Thiolinea sp.]|nr:hypothetical protein [Thiolinea sp.]